MTKNKSSFREFWEEHDAIAVWCYNALMIIPWLISAFGGISSSGEINLSPFFWMVSFAPTALAFFLVYNRKKQSKCTVKELLRLPCVCQLHAIILRGILLGVFLFCVSFYLISFWSQYLTNYGIEASPQYLVEILYDGQISSLQILGLALLVGVFAPFSEEIFYRSIIFGQFRRIHGKLYSYFLSGAYFAVVHTNLFALPGVFLAGIIFAYAYDMKLPKQYCVEGSSNRAGLVGAVVAHLTFNLLSFADIIL